MRLEQKTFRITGIDSKKLPTDVKNLKLVVNKNKTNVLLSELFISSKCGIGFIKGWSLLQFLDNSEIDINNNKYNILIYSEDSEELYEVSSISNPMIQMSDKVISQNQVDEYVKIIVDNATEDIQSTDSNPSPGDSIDKVDDNSSEDASGSEVEDSGLPQPEESTEDNDKNNSEESKSVEDPDEYKRVCSDIKLKGYKEYSFNKYRLLYKPNTPVDELYMVIIDYENNDFNTVTLELVENTPSNILYKFYEDSNKMLLLLELQDKKITVLNK